MRGGKEHPLPARMKLYLKAIQFVVRQKPKTKTKPTSILLGEKNL